MPTCSKLQLAQLMMTVLDRLAEGERFDDVVEATGITARVGECIKEERSVVVGGVGATTPAAAVPSDPLITLLVHACEMGLQLILDNWPEEHGQAQVGETWGALESAIKEATGTAPRAAPMDVDAWRARWGSHRSAVSGAAAS